MESLVIKYHNIDTDKLKNLLDSDKYKLRKIKEQITKIPALNIVNNSLKLDQMILTTDEFSKNKSNFIVFGTGGSNLGAKALINILIGNQKKTISFYDNIDPLDFKNFLNKFDLFNTGFIIISKSGLTAETLSQFGCLVEVFEQKKQLKKLYKNCLVITDKNDSPLRKIAEKNNCLILDHENDIGGRYSVFSNVGLVPAIIAGVDVKKIHLGVKDFLNKIKESSYDQYFETSKLLTSKEILENICCNVIMTYSNSLFYFGKWYLQLWSESIGKDNFGITPIHSVGTTDQHSQLQLYLDGPRDKFFTFITTNHSNNGLKINNNIFNNTAHYLSGKFMGDVMQAEQQATLDTFLERKIPFREINISKIDEYSLGQLMSFFILETIAACNFININAFDQPAVERGKKLTIKYLSQNLK